jgi:hypothetical protein
MATNTNAQISYSKGLMWSNHFATNISGNALPSTLSIRNNDGNTRLARTLLAEFPGRMSLPVTMPN